MAQIPDDVYFVSYFSNARGTLDATVRIDNPGVDAGKNLCAYIYVFDSVEEQVMLRLLVDCGWSAYDLSKQRLD